MCSLWKFVIFNEGWDQRGACRFKKCRDAELQYGQHVQKPQTLRAIHQQKAKDDFRGEYVTQDEDFAPVQAICNNACQGSQQNGGKAWAMNKPPTASPEGA